MEDPKDIIWILLDTSGSMSEHWSTVMEIVDAELNDIRCKFTSSKAGDLEAGMTTYAADIGEVLHFDTAASIPCITVTTWRPDGLSAMNDALFDTILMLRSRWESERSMRATRVTLKVITVGSDNASREHTLAEVRRLIHELQETGEWTFAFLADDPDRMEANALMSLRNKYADLQDEDTFRQDVMQLLFYRAEVPGVGSSADLRHHKKD